MSLKCDKLFLLAIFSALLCSSRNEKISELCRDLNPEQLCEKRECFLCAMLPPKLAKMWL